MKFNLFLTTLLMLVFAWPSSAQNRPSEIAPEILSTLLRWDYYPVENYLASLQEPTKSNSAPLTPDELREGILRIEQGILAAKEADLLRKSMADRDTLSQRERVVADRELDLEKQRTQLAQQTAAVEKSRGDFYENAFKAVTKKTSFGCKVARVFTLGLAKCGR